MHSLKRRKNEKSSSHNRDTCLVVTACNVLSKEVYLYLSQNERTFTRHKPPLKESDAYYSQGTSGSHKPLQCPKLPSNQSNPRLELTTDNSSRWMENARKSSSRMIQSVAEWLWTGIEWSDDTNSDVFSRRAFVTTEVNPICHTVSVSFWFTCIQLATKHYVVIFLLSEIRIII